MRASALTEARALQEQLRAQIRLEPLPHEPRVIAGVDVSSNRYSNTLYAGWLVMSYPDLKEIDRSLAMQETDFPYIPGFLSFREIPALLVAYEKLKTKPELVMVDGQGIAHPRRLGIATHLGIQLNIPTIGFAKSRLYGIGDMPGPNRGDIEYLHDPKAGGEKIGAYVRTKPRANPMVISPGHRVTLNESIRFALDTTRGYRIPEPTGRTHDMVNAFRRGEIS